MEILKVQSTEDKLTYLLQTKALIKQAIIDQGGTIDENTTFRQFVTAIAELDTIDPAVIEEIQQTLVEIAEIEEQQNEEIQNIVSVLNTKLEEADVADLRTQANSNTSRIEANESSIESLDSRATTLEGKATELENSKANQTDLDSTNTRVQLAEAAIQANTGDINAIKTRVETAENNITANTQAISDEAASRMAADTTLEQSIATNTSDISEIKTNIENIEEAVETNTTAITTNRADFDQAVIDINEEIEKRLTTEAAKPLIKRVDYNSTTATFTFEDMEGNTKTVDLPLEATVKGGRYDANRKVLILILVSDDEIEIPVEDLVDVYTGVDGTKIKVIINNQNQISAEIKAGTIERDDLANSLKAEIDAKATKVYVDEEIAAVDEKVETNKTNIEALQGRVTTAEENITTNTENIESNTQAISDLETEVDGKLTMKELGDELLVAAKATAAGTLVPKIFADLQFSHKYRLMLPYITINNTGAVSYGFQDLLSNSVNDKDTNPVTLEFVKDENDDDVYIKLAIDQSKLTEVGKVDTVNNIQPDANKNITLDGSNINVDETAQTKTSIKDSISDVKERLLEEEINRTHKDSELAEEITAERVNRETADTTLQSNITAEETSRIAADAELQANLTTEETNRESADQALQDQIDAITIPEYSMVESTTIQGYAKTYSLTKDGVETGTKINIPKDLVIKSGEVKVVTTPDVPYEGAVVGDKYLDIELNDATADHIYIPVKDLVDVYTGKRSINVETIINENNEIESTVRSGTLTISDFDIPTRRGLISALWIVTENNMIKLICRDNMSTPKDILIFSNNGDTKPTIDNSNNLIYNTDAEEVDFNPSTSGLQSTKLAPAIRELKGSVDTNTSDISDLQDAIEEAGKVDTVNNIQPDSNKNITLDATQINVDETAATKVTIKSNLEDLATQIWNEHEAQDQINQYVHEDIDGLGERISTEETTRENADQELQNQIDSIHIPDVPEYTIEEQAQAETGYSKTYYLTKDGTQVGSKINIPKDLVIKSGEIKTVTVADQPYEGAQVGDKYIDITLNDVNEEHIYIPVKDLVDTYTGVDGSKINVTINSQNQIEARIKTGTIQKTDLASNLVAIVDRIEASRILNNLIASNNNTLELQGFNSNIMGTYKYIKFKSEDNSNNITINESTVGSNKIIEINQIVDSENVDFDSSTSGLTSTKISPAIRELKGLVDNAGAVNTVNSVTADQNKNVQLDASNINLDDTAATPETLKSIIETQAAKITTLEGKVAELESALGDIRTALELLNGVEDANNEEF